MVSKPKKQSDSVTDCVRVQQQMSGAVLDLWEGARYICTCRMQIIINEGTMKTDQRHSWLVLN